MKSLTTKQVNILTTLDVVREVNARGILSRNPEAIPTRFVSWFQLNRDHGVTLFQLERLVKAGYLVKGSSIGSGPEFARV